MQDGTEVTQESLAQQYNASVGIGDNLDNNVDNNAEINELEKAGSIVELTEDETSAYSEYLGSDIPDNVFKNDAGEAYSRKEVIQNLNKEVAKVASSSYSEDGFIKDYLEAKNQEGFDRDEYIKSLNQHNAINDMPTDEVLSKYYESQKYNKEDIERHLASKTPIEKDELAKQIKNQIKSNAIKKRQESFQSYFESRKQDLETKNEQTKAILDKYVNDSLTSKYPIRFTKEEADARLDGMKSLLSHEIIKDKNGNYVERHGLDDFLEDDEKLLKALPILEMINNNTFDDFMSNYSKSIKDREFDKLDGAKAGSFGSGGSKKGIDYDKLYADN